MSTLDAVQKRAIRFIGDLALICHLQPLSRRPSDGDLSLFYRIHDGNNCKLNAMCKAQLVQRLY
nr:unnamed protein product [Callosobruchus chinensis]